MCAETHVECVHSVVLHLASRVSPLLFCLHASTVTMIVTVRRWVYVYTNTRTCAPDECVLSDVCDERRLT